MRDTALSLLQISSESSGDGHGFTLYKITTNGRSHLALDRYADNKGFKRKENRARMCGCGFPRVQLWVALENPRVARRILYLHFLTDRNLIAHQHAYYFTLLLNHIWDSGECHTTHRSSETYLSLLLTDVLTLPADPRSQRLRQRYVFIESH